MHKSKFSESQIVAILKEADSGIPVADVLRNHGISAATFYKWRSKYGGLEASELKRIKELEQQLEEFKAIVADLTLENKGMRELLEKSSDARQETGGSRLSSSGRTTDRETSMFLCRHVSGFLLSEANRQGHQGRTCH